uniref:Ubiquitin-like domain-containing protein n=1 Tax=Rhizochromulina marina TaxID=1034831 RepID=A0A7S2RY85_9STRA|mmetsp:Transcript_22660/g.65968  ORF Transcript_22660/g.65968 Transcript_22660/m.65968 type:complete len:136 (+) Transcript_22660:100-507(+)
MAYDVVPDAKAEFEPGRKLTGLGLDLSLASASKGSPRLQEEDLVLQRATEPVIVVFDLPDGSQVEHKFQMGQTIEVLKSFVASECGIPMGGQDLFLEGLQQPLMDPLTLLDYSQIDPASEVLVRVEGTMHMSAKK